VVVELLLENKGTWAPEEVRIVGLGEILPGAISTVLKSRSAKVVSCLSKM
jgi:hypothetical protein